MVHQVADSQDFDAQLKQAGGKLVVVDFFATWQVPMILIQFFFILGVQRVLKLLLELATVCLCHSLAGWLILEGLLFFVASCYFLYQGAVPAR